MRILVTGANGGMGREAPHAFTGDELSLASRAECDVTDPAAVDAAVQAARPELILHAAAYTAVDRAEAEPEPARRVNVEGAINVARAARRAGALLVYPSTDYVFDGRKNSPYTESDQPNPLSVYGRTKLEGEQAALAEHPGTFVVRGSVYWQHGKSFAATMQRLLNEQPEVKAISDQSSSLTYGRDFLTAVRKLVEVGQPGLYHAAAAGSVSRYDFVKAMAEHEKSECTVVAVTTAEWGATADRPAHSALDCGKLAKLGITLPDWKTGLTRFFEDAS